MNDNQIKVANFEITGWPALVIAGLILLTMGYQAFGSRAVTDASLREAVIKEINLEHQRATLPDLQDALDDGDSVRAEALSEQLHDVDVRIYELTSSKPVGDWIRPDEVTVAVTYSMIIDDIESPKQTRYFWFEKMTLGGWYFRNDVSKLSYYLDFI